MQSLPRTDSPVNPGPTGFTLLQAAKAQLAAKRASQTRKKSDLLIVVERARKGRAQIIPAPGDGYRLLLEGEACAAGDQFWHSRDKAWLPVNPMWFGRPWTAVLNSAYRRQLPQLSQADLCAIELHGRAEDLNTSDFPRLATLTSEDTTCD